VVLQRGKGYYCFIGTFKLCIAPRKIGQWWEGFLEEAIAVDEEVCKFFFKSRQLSGIFCGIKIYEAGRRTVASVSFTVDPGQ
jgi:hypothetical protein